MAIMFLMSKTRLNTGLESGNPAEQKLEVSLSKERQTSSHFLILQIHIWPAEGRVAKPVTKPKILARRAWKELWLQMMALSARQMWLVS